MDYNLDEDSSINREKKWTPDHESILIDWADKAMCYRWLHSKANSKYNKLNSYFTIPVIIMSTITGTANFAAERVPIAYRSYFSMGVGGVNIIAGIISTIQQFLKISELNEAHRVSSISWDKFYRKIRVELSKPPFERQNVSDFLKLCTEEFDRLMETSPQIDKSVIGKFHATFDKLDLDIKKPEICDSLESIKTAIYKHPEVNKYDHSIKNIVNDIVTNIDKNNDYNKKELIKTFCNKFKDELLRLPTKDEIMNNLSNDTIEISENLIDECLNEFNTIIDNTNNIANNYSIEMNNIVNNAEDNV